MSRYRTSEEIYHYDRFKLLVLLLLLAALLGLILFSDQQGLELGLADAPGAETDSTMATATADAVAGVPDSATLEPTADAAVATPELVVPIIATPLLIAPQPGTDLTAGEVIFAGTGEPNLLQRILVDGQLAGETTIDAGGNWAVPVTLAAGSPQIMLNTIDANGGVVAQSGPFVFNVTEGGAVPGDGTTPVLVAPPPGTDLTAGEVIFAGRGEPGLTIRVLADGQLVGETTTDSGGNWIVPVTLAAGSPQIMLNTLGADGSVVGESGPYVFNVIESGAAPGDSVTPSLVAPQPGTDLTAGQVTFGGTGGPGLTIRVLANDQLVGETTISPGGTWIVPVTLPVGSTQIMLNTVDANGGVVAQSGPYVFNVIEGAAVPGDGSTGAPAVGSNSGLNPLTGAVSLTGTAPAGSTVVITVNGVPVATTVADEDGNWTAEVPPGGGPLTVQAQVTDPAGAVTTTDPVTIEDPSGAPGLSMPGQSFPNPETGEAQLTVPSGGSTWSGTGLPNTNVEIIVDGQSMGVVPVDEEGNWTTTLALPPGSHTVQLVTIDPTTGEQLGTTQEIPFTVVDEAQPTVDIPETGWVSGTNEISGTATPGSALAVFVNGIPVTMVTTGDDGTWTATIDLTTGSSVIDVRAVDENGNVIFGSEPLTVLVVGTEPTIGDVLVQAGQFNILLAAAQATGLDATLATGGPFTLFAPPDPAFTSLPAGVLDGWLANPQYLTSLLLHHIVTGEVSTEAAVQAGTLTTNAGDTLTISREGTLVRVDSASILFPNVDASNGVVHVIDEVLLPTLPAGVQGPVIDTAGVPTFTGPLLTVVGAAQPGYTILVQLNGQNFGQIATVDSTGFWQVSQDVTAGRYEIVAYMFDPTGILVGISDPVTLLVR